MFRTAPVYELAVCMRAYCAAGDNVCRTGIMWELGRM